MLLGDAALIGEARRWRKMLGGGLRQSGLLAAAALYALDHHVERLAQDHARAARLAALLHGLDGIAVAAQHTNMVFIEVDASRLRALDAHLQAHGVRASIGYLPTVRLVTHLDIDDAAIEAAGAAFRSFAA